ncbi:IkappaB kinase complex IKAP component [Rhodocollybia butyracea]|uniref:Elongator complex protein 1 n=1 Tax=Rhodocollybia butyracea TaxID=206335 RepID=A0A9P5Q7C0_9AGAR|nr:IkappaB kinase complex IKAP component [Rhodocollybia butyracea]
MRNLSLGSFDVASFNNTNVSGIAIDLDENVLYVASENQSVDEGVNVQIYRIDKNALGAAPECIATFTTAAHGPTAQVISLRVIQDNRNLVAITRNGDITTASLDDEIPMMEVQGSVDDGILAASWSPDDSLLALVTGTNKLILMTLTFDIISEAALETTDFGQDMPINVGWGSKQTQFHGSLGKAAAQASTSDIFAGCSPDEDNFPRISWRGDGAYFVVSSITNSGSLPHRVLRVYDHQAVLQSTSEPIPGLEHTLSWRPSGSLIASTQRFGKFEGGGAGREGKHDVVFFERNGLRHGDFELRPDQGLASVGGKLKWGYKVKEVRWSSDSNVVALWIERDSASDLVQLWTTGNYHWYLKQEISAPSQSHFTSVEWHPELALELILATSSQVFFRTYIWETTSSMSKPPIDSGSVAVIDGSTALLTSFRTQNVPPPMSSTQLAAHVPIHWHFLNSFDALGFLWEHGYVEIYDLHTRLVTGRGKADDALGLDAPRSFIVVVLGSSLESDVVTVIKFDGEQLTETVPVIMSSCNGRLLSSSDAVLWEAKDGELFRVDAESGTSTSFGGFLNFCSTAQHITLASTDICIGLIESGRLQVCGKNTQCRTLAMNVTSFTVASGYLIYTTGAHEAVFAPLETLIPLLANADDPDNLKAIPSDWEKRRIERGSRIVVCIPSSMSLVLQMPRGNLETINPRPLVLEVVKQDLNAGEYRKAFFSCRKHRIDMNFLVEHDETAFLDGLSTFVTQVHEVDHLNLFLTNLGQGMKPLSSETIRKISDALREKLEEKDIKAYVNTILTAHVIKSPPDHESALSLLLRLKGAEPTLVEDAVKYIIFLVDANKLFDTALGMYDFSLVLMVAQHSQKVQSPLEDKNYQKFRIDDHLARYTSALRNLALANTEHFGEALQYIERHSLYEVALSIWTGTDRYEEVLIIYGDWLFERREFRQAAAVFVEAKSLQKAMVSYEKALEWQDLFELALRHSELANMEDIQAMAYRLSEDLTSKKRYAEAARIILDYTSDVRTAVITLVQGHEFSEALRIVSYYAERNPELVEDVIHPGALESKAQFDDDVSEMKEQLRKQLNRIRELRVKKIEEPDEFYGVEDTALHNVDVMTDVSMAPTAFTRYTVAPSTAASRTTKRSSRSKRKMERKVGSGRKGTVDEEEYLLRSITKLVGRFSGTRGESKRLLPHLLKFTSEHREEGMAMQKELEKFESELNAAVEEIWTIPMSIDGDGDGQTQPLADSWAARMEEVHKQRRINPVERVAKPQTDGEAGDWKMRLLELQ